MAFIEASIDFLGPCVGKPRFYERSEDLNNLPLETRLVRIEDLRGVTPTPSLEVEGFELVKHTTAVADFFDPAGRTLYLREMEDLVRELTGAVKVVALGNGVIRRSERSRQFGAPGTTVPGRFAHSDFSAGPRGSDYWVEKILPEREAKERLANRFAIYNCWRTLSEPPQDTPLAFCDPRSINPEDCLSSDQVIEPPDGPALWIENEMLRYAESQRWGFFPHLTRDEVLAFRGYDSRLDSGRSGGVPHAAFDDPNCGPDTPPRESIDERVVAFFES